MARRASKTTNTSTLVGIVAALVIALIGVIFVLGKKTGDTSGSLSDFPTEDYLTRGSVLRDNEYKLSGRIEERYPRGDSEMIVLVVKRASGVEERLPVIVPQDVKSINLEREQEYNFKVRVVSKDNAKGLLYAESVTQAR